MNAQSLQGLLRTFSTARVNNQVVASRISRAHIHNTKSIWDSPAINIPPEMPPHFNMYYVFLALDRCSGFLLSLKRKNAGGFITLNEHANVKYGITCI